jgi:hypothetical protein
LEKKRGGLYVAARTRTYAGGELIVMVERYRNHLIFVKANQDPATALWKAATHIQFNEDPRTFRDVWLPRPNVGLRTKKSAEKQMMKEARKWVDDWLRKVDLGVLVVFAQTSVLVPFICTMFSQK